MTLQTTTARKARPQAEPTLFTGQSTTGPGLPADDDDFVSDVLRLVRSMVPAVDEEQARQVDAALRERWGGDRPFIARRLGEGRSIRNEAIRRDYLAGERLALLERRYNLSQRRLLQIVKG